ncbi:MAG: hypothetical protein KBT64_07435, partial [Sulfitobacter litoralis]|nr:hypothetical protein [Sulfitobacter litoralis]
MAKEVFITLMRAEGEQKRAEPAPRPMSSMSKVCGCCQRELQRRQIRQGGKRGLFLVLWGLCVTAAAFDAQSERDF